jgi:hypothetical protein
VLYRCSAVQLLFKEEEGKGAPPQCVAEKGNVEIGEARRLPSFFSAIAAWFRPPPLDVDLCCRSASLSLYPLTQSKKKSNQPKPSLLSGARPQIPRPRYRRRQGQHRRR